MKSRATITRIGPDEILKRVGPAMFHEAYSRGMSLSAYMEHLNPTDDQDKGSLDAFGRVMKEAGIIARSIPEQGIYADTWEDAFNPGDPARRALAVEYCVRKYREASYAGRPANTRQLFTSLDVPLGSPLRPYIEAAGQRVQALSATIPLAELVATTTPIDGDAYRAVYVTDTANSGKRMVRVGQTAEIPRITLVASDRTVPLYKYGRAIESTYEVLRRMRLDRVALVIQLMAIQAEIDKVSTVVDVMLNGDGNASTAATNTNSSTLDAASTTALTLRAWLGFKLLFDNPYSLTTILSPRATILDLQLLATPNANLPLFMIAGQGGLGGLAPINNQLSDGVRYGTTSDVPTGKYLGFDRRFAIERVTEIGANLVETERFILRQTEVLAMTEVEGYAVMDARAMRVLTLA